jgi:tetratricopeptide (TPR) repeat protein
LKQAITHAQRAIVLDDSIDNTTGIAAALVTMASAMIARGEYESALIHTQRAYNLQSTPQASPLLSRILGILGLAELRAGSLDFAQAQLQEALHLARAFGDTNSGLWIMHGLCELYLCRGAVESARTLAMGCLGSAVRNGNTLMAAQFALFVSQTYLQAGNCPQALDYARRAEKLAKHSYLWRYKLQAMMFAGEALLCMQKPKSATRYAQAALQLFRGKDQKLAEEADLKMLVTRCRIEWTHAFMPTDTPAPESQRPQ